MQKEETKGQSSEDAHLDKYALNLDEAAVSVFYEKLLAMSVD